MAQLAEKILADETIKPVLYSSTQTTAIDSPQVVMPYLAGSALCGVVFEKILWRVLKSRNKLEFKHMETSNRNRIITLDEFILKQQKGVYQLYR